MGSPFQIQKQLFFPCSLPFTLLPPFKARRTHGRPGLPHGMGSSPPPAKKAEAAVPTPPPPRRRPFLLPLHHPVVCASLLLLLLCCGTLPSKASSPTKTRNGWRSSEFKVGSGADDDDGTWIEVVSWAPRAFFVHNIITAEECDYLVTLAKPHIAQTTVLNASGESVVDVTSRTAYGVFVTRNKDAAVMRIGQRISVLIGIPPQNSEDYNVLRYQHGQKYVTHGDFFDEAFLTQVVSACVRACVRASLGRSS